METRNGFILGVYNFCDRWCETCPLTSRCRLFAEAAALEAALDPGFRPIVDAPPLPESVAPPPPKWFEELLERLSVEPAATAGSGGLEPEASPRHAAIQSRAERYSSGIGAWLEARDYLDAADCRDPRAVVQWFSTLIPAKVERALSGLGHGPEDGDWPADHDGSAKVALLGADRSRAALLDMVERGLASPGEVEPFMADLVKLGRDLEDVFSGARRFVRPGFDEPDELEKLAVAEW
jgi:hypothetical protein